MTHVHSTRERTTALRSERRGHRQPKPSGFRLDIQGLRAIAVAGVVLYHLWPNWLPGGFVGVDVFFVISGFLITSHLLRKPPRRAKDVIAFWARRVSRLLPAALLVITVTCIAVFFLAPKAVWHDTGSQALAATGYMQNWYLANESVDYLASDNKPTALQHFWSLSVEEQFYFIWPIIIGLIAWCSTRLGVGLKRTTGVVLTVLTAGLLVFSIWYSFTEPASAYFISPTRFWELALGGIVAVFCGHWSATTGIVRTCLSWLGIAGIIASFWLISAADVFPGWAALLPTVSTALVIAGNSVSSLSPLCILGNRPVQFIGTTSYAIYLWHWPLIILLPYVSGELGILDKLVIIAVTMVLAYGTMVLVETRFRKSAVFSALPRTFAVALIGMLIAGSSGMALRIGFDRSVAAEQGSLESALQSDDPCVGARAIGTGGAIKAECRTDGPLLLGPEAARSDKSDAYPDGCWSNMPFTEHPVCHYGTGKKRVALIGNSHAGHWLPALQTLAADNDWTIDTYLVDRCNANNTDQVFDSQEKTDGCRKWSEWATEQIATQGYDAVVTSERQSVEIKNTHDSNTASQRAYAEVLKDWQAADVPVIVLRDNPTPARGDVNPPLCVAEHGPTSPKCQGTAKQWRVVDPLAEAAQNAKGITVIDPEKQFCPQNTCPSAIGGVVVYFDTTHMTATYAATLSNWLGKQLADQAPDLISRR